MTPEASQSLRSPIREELTPPTCGLQPGSVPKTIQSTVADPFRPTLDVEVLETPKRAIRPLPRSFRRWFGHIRCKGFTQRIHEQKKNQLHAARICTMGCHVAMPRKYVHNEFAKISMIQKETLFLNLSFAAIGLGAYVVPPHSGAATPTEVLFPASV